MLGLCKLLSRNFACGITACPQLGNARRIDIKADHWALLAKFDGKGQTDIAKANDGDGFLSILH
jgi:hypothetical protein